MENLCDRTCGVALELAAFTQVYVDASGGVILTLYDEKTVRTSEAELAALMMAVAEAGQMAREWEERAEETEIAENNARIEKDVAAMSDELDTNGGV